MEVKEKEKQVDEVRDELAKAAKQENELKAAKIEEERKVKDLEGSIKGKKNQISSYQQAVSLAFLNYCIF